MQPALRFARAKMTEASDEKGDREKMFWRRDKQRDSGESGASVQERAATAPITAEGDDGETAAHDERESAHERAAGETHDDVETAADGDETPSAQEPVTQERVIDAIRTVFDPEIPVNIYELGLIYGVILNDSETRPGGTDVDVKMTLTSPHCPVAETLPGDVARAVRTVQGVGEVDVEIVWDPTWNPDMMSEAAKLELGMF